MADLTVKKLAADLGYPTAKLLEQLLAAGIAVSGEDAELSNEQKQKLLTHLTASAKPKLGAKKLSLGGKPKTTTADTGGISVRKVRSVTTPSEPVVSVSEEAKKRQELVQAKIEEEKRLSEDSNAARKKREAEIRAEKEALQQKIEAAKKGPEEPVAPVEPVLVEEVKVAPEAAPAPADVRVKSKITQPQPIVAPVDEVATRKKKNAPKVRKKETESSTLSAMELYEQEQEILRAAEVQAEIEAERAKSRKTKKKVAMPKNQHGFKKPTAPIIYEVDIPETVTVSELAAKMSVKSTVVIKVLMKLGMMVTINQALDQDTGVIVVEELGHKANLVSVDTVEDTLEEDHHQNEFEAKSRPPVVTIMGHVDHGKTSLLDYIRKAKVADGEAGGITQHIGAYRVQSEGETICFLDTPGHAAFTAMRSRGAKATDIVILVVAADDGVMPQTIEAIQHAKAADVPIIVAINKMDKQGADPEKILGELAQHEVVTENWGGEVLMAQVSAHTGDGVDDLLSQIIMQSEVLELKAPVTGAAKGVVVEARLDKGRGAVVTLLVQQGQLNKGDMVLCGTEFGRVRAMSDDKGKKITEAGPSTPVEIFGLSGVPQAGDDFLVTPNERKAREVAQHRQEKSRETKLDSRSAVTLDNLFSQMEESQMGTVNIVLKADVNGSVEALKDALLKLSNSEVKVNIVGFGVGGISESDVTLAAASGAILIAFNVRAEVAARKLIEQEQVDVRYYSIIYEAIEQVKQALEGLLAPEFREDIIGMAQVRDVFKSPKYGSIAGCLVMDGMVKKSNPIRVLRENVVIYEGELESLRRFKDDVKEVQSGTECGIGVKNYNDVRPGDEIEVYERVEVKRTLESAKI